MSFKVIDKKLLKRYTKIWEKTSSLMNKKFDSEHVYGDLVKYIKTKIQIFRAEKYQKKIYHTNVCHL